MENTAIEKTGTSNSGKYLLMATVVTGLVFLKRKTFLDFIDNLKLSLRLRELTENIVVLNIMPLTALNIPYSIKSIDLVQDKRHIASTNSSCDLHKRIVSNSNIEINFKILEQNISQNDIENSKIAIVYSFLGFTFKRLYDPVEFGFTKSTTIDMQPTSCGCQR